MMQIACAICNSTDVVPGKYTFTFHCNKCDKDLAMYEIKYIVAGKETNNEDRDKSLVRGLQIIPTARKW